MYYTCRTVTFSSLRQASSPTLFTAAAWSLARRSLPMCFGLEAIGPPSNNEAFHVEGKNADTWAVQHTPSPTSSLRLQSSELKCRRSGLTLHTRSRGPVCCAESNAMSILGRGGRCTRNASRWFMQLAPPSTFEVSRVVLAVSTQRRGMEDYGSYGS